MKRLIYITGCDDSTSVVIDLTDDEFEVVQRIAAASVKASSYGCQPVIELDSEDNAKHYGCPRDDDE